MNQLDKIDKAQPECHAFVAVMQGLARQFEFEAMARQIDAQTGAQATLQKSLSGAMT
jgi:Asp-tRNA(Asn)/Glu-tRNA(Gln) amidotransferase A subunit family amidase